MEAQNSDSREDILLENGIVFVEETDRSDEPSNNDQLEIGEENLTTNDTVALSVNERRLTTTSNETPFTLVDHYIEDNQNVSLEAESIELQNINGSSTEMQDDGIGSVSNDAYSTCSKKGSTASSGTNDVIINVEAATQTGPSRVITTRIAKKIFFQLQMFQYLEELKNNDESILGTFNFYGIEYDKPLREHFLKKWLEDQGLGDKNIQNWDFEGGTITKDQFIHKIASNTHQDGEVYGAGIFSTNTDVEANEDEEDETLEAVENRWGITQGVRKEWGGTFDKLLTYHNKSDLGTISRSICCRKPGVNIRDSFVGNLRKSDLIDGEELKQWLTPRLEPYMWQKYLWRKRYDDEKEHYDKVHKALFGDCRTGDCRTSVKNPQVNDTQNGISKDVFLKRVIKELRNENKEIMVALKKLCLRLERAEFYELYPPKLFMIGVTLMQILLFCYHKYYYHSYFDKHNIEPSCSMWVMNPDRSWLEPWRFLTYGFVHNNFMEHLLVNSFLQLFFGIPLELSNGSCRIALTYLSGIFLGGIGREVFSARPIPLAGASGGVYALVAAHLAHLILNWDNDSFVMRQRLNWFSSSSDKTPKPPAALPASGLVRWCRLIVALVVLGLTLRPLEEPKSRDVDYVSHATHLFGALSGLLAGCIFLKARNFKTRIKYFKIFLLFIYVFLISFVVIKCLREANKVDDDEYCIWEKYEDVCQDQCYPNVTRDPKYQMPNCTVSFCKKNFR